MRDNLLERFPYSAHHTQLTDLDRAAPREIHPAFHSSYDWHSCVHMHWLGVELLGAGVLEDAEAARLAALLEENLTAENLDAESRYLRANPSWERPYGWAWLLRLCASALGSADPRPRSWGENLLPAARTVAELALAWMAKTDLPVRHGIHTNSAFGLALMLSAARELGRLREPGESDAAASSVDWAAFARAIEDTARRWFGADAGWPSEWETSGQDFLSAGLTEADLMARVLGPEEFPAWFARFLPELAAGPPDASARILASAAVKDESDGQSVHLHGLNLSRAGQLWRIAAVLGHASLREHGDRLFEAGSAGLASSNFMSTHWLASFAWDALASRGGQEAAL